jgi:hypothetical protein
MSTQDRCTVCAEHVIGSEIISDAPDGTPTVMGQVEARLGLFGDIVNLGTRQGHSLCQIYHRHGNLFGRTGQ